MLKTKVKEIKKVADGTLEVTLERPEGFEFLAGQYTQVHLLNLDYPDSKGPSRTFTIVSSPLTKERISIAYRHSGSGYKKTLSNLKKGDIVGVDEPLGFFTLPDGGKHIFIAGGIGIAPFMSMLRTVRDMSNMEITLVYANRDLESAAYLRELKEFTENLDNFNLVPVFGRITAEDLQDYIEPMCYNWWIVGPEGMVAEVRQIITSRGVPENKICTEEFIGY